METEAADSSGVARSEAASPDLAAQRRMNMEHGRSSAERVDGPEQAATAAVRAGVSRSSDPQSKMD